MPADFRRADAPRIAVWHRHDAAVVAVVGAAPVALAAVLLGGEGDPYALAARLDRAGAAYDRFDAAEREAHPDHAAAYDALDLWAEQAGPALLGAAAGAWPHDAPAPPPAVPGHLDRALAAFRAAPAGSPLRLGLAVALRTLGMAAALRRAGAAPDHPTAHGQDA